MDPHLWRTFPVNNNTNIAATSTRSPWESFSQFDFVTASSPSFSTLTSRPNGTSAMGNVTVHSTPPNLEAFQSMYLPVHGILAPIICVLGIVANCLNIVVLTRKNMITPTNILLTGLAISDGLTMAAYFPYSILNYHVYKQGEPPPPLGNAHYLLFFAIFSVIMHSISIWLTVSLAIFRYIVIRYPRRGARLCSVQRANLTVIIVCVVVTVVCIPNSVIYDVYEMKSENSNETGWHIDVRNDTAGFIFLKRFNLWIQATLVKLMPCFLLSVLSILLIKQMKDAEKRRKTLLNKNGKGDDESKRHRKTNRTTRMLVVVVVLFVVTETPQGFLQLLGGVVDGFFNNIYGPLGDVMDTLALFNNGINFVLYCTMSKSFRDTFIKIFLRDIISDSSTRTTMLVSTQPTRDSDV